MWRGAAAQQGGGACFWMGKSAGNGDGSFPFPLFEWSIAVFDCSRGKKGNFQVSVDLLAVNRSHHEYIRL
jgi:hypothetical protein